MVAFLGWPCGNHNVPAWTSPVTSGVIGSRSTGRAAALTERLAVRSSRIQLVVQPDAAVSDSRDIRALQAGLVCRTRRGNCADQQPGDCPDVPTDPSGDVFGDGVLSGRAGVGSPGRPRSPTSNASAAAARPASPFLTVPPSPVSRSSQSSCPHVHTSLPPPSLPLAPVPSPSLEPFPLSFSPPHTPLPSEVQTWPLAAGARP